MVDLGNYEIGDLYVNARIPLQICQRLLDGVRVGDPNVASKEIGLAVDHF